MATAAGHAKRIFKAVQDDKKKKESGMGKFMTGVKDFFTSPGGIVVIIAVVAIVWYINHKTAEE